MSVNGRFDEIRRAVICSKVADRFVVSDPKGALGSVAAAIRAWPEFAGAAGVPSRNEGPGAERFSDRLRQRS